MKTILKIITFSLLIVFTISCNEEEENFDFIRTVEAPLNVKALFDVTQDNTGLVSIVPTADNAVKFDIYFGDGTEDPVSLNQGEQTEHTYTEGTYEVTLVAHGPTGLSSEVTQELVVSFIPPEITDVVVVNDEAVSKKINVTVTADNAITYDVYFGEEGNDEPLSANIGDTVSYIYENVGLYTITIEVKGAAIETTTYVVENFEVIALVQPSQPAPTPPVREPDDVISIFSAAYENIENVNYFPDWGQGGQGSSWNMFDLNGDEMLQYINISYQGIALEEGTSIDVSGMEYLHLDVWTADVVTDIETSLINNASGTVTEAPVTNSLTTDTWTSIDIPISDYTDQGLTVSEIFQLKFVGTPWAAGTIFIDNIYFWKEATGPSPLIGTWKFSEEPGSLGVGPAMGDISWWNCDAGCVTERACLYDDLYIFNADGTFNNVLGTETWIEGWQGGSDACDTPVAPYDGTAEATFDHNQSEGSITINGLGAYLGIPKANNQGELPNVDVPDSITYQVNFLDTDTISVYIESGSGVFWQYKLVRTDTPDSPIVGTWQLSTEPGSLGVGPAIGDIGWWNCDATCVTERACFYDDQYIFNSDGSFQNILGSETWIEGWQGGSDACGTPVAPHDGSNAATYEYNLGAGTITLNGLGAYLGLPKANNQGELPNVDVPDSITYDVTFTDDTHMDVVIEAGSGVFWQYKFVKI